MSKRLLSLSLVLMSAFFYTTNFSQNVLPTSGNVGIGTTAPSSDLEVKGRTTVEEFIAYDTAIFEKPVTIKDSLKIESRMTVDQDVKIKGQTVLVDDVKAKSDLKVFGTTQMKGDGVVEGNFKFKGLEDQTITDDRFLMIKPNGKAVSMEKAGLVNLMYQPQFCIKDPSGVTPAPIWDHIDGQNGGDGILYTGANCDASVGIGTASPLARLDVRGTTYLSGNTYIGITPGTPNSPVSQLYINQESGSRNALTVELTTTIPNLSGIGINTIVDNNNRIALNVQNPNIGNVFSVYGDGSLSISNQASANSSISVSNVSGDEVFKVSGNGDVSIMNMGKLVFDGTQPNWNSWETAICSPMGAAWVSTQPTDGNSPVPGYYTGIGMTNTGLYYGRSQNTIGSTNTDIQYLFAVDLEGRIRARAIKIYDFGWADYVFADDYELMDISGVEEYIKFNKHLPNIPSAEELNNTELDLGKMQQLQMEKIEELMLYIIQLEKRIKELEE